MHLHILGIGGTFMSALALLAKELGYQVTGCDSQCYSPMKELLQAHDIDWVEGYEENTWASSADLIIVGNAIKRGMPVLERILNEGKVYTSGPAWLAEKVLSRYQVLAVAGTHGKTTTSSMLAFILDRLGLAPGFLIGGIPPNFRQNARLGKGRYFVIEADEYDSAFFDKRPKLMHYRPQISIINNLEFDHADIYEDLAAIQKQFHYYLKTIPSQGTVIIPEGVQSIETVLSKGIFSKLKTFSLKTSACSVQAEKHYPAWQATLLDDAGQSFRVSYQNQVQGTVNWPLIGRFNVENALAALAVAHEIGINPAEAMAVLEDFKPVKRRLEVVFQKDGLCVYDDFAHHPTAIAKTLEALKQSKRHQRLFVLLEFASYTMREGIQIKAIPQALSDAEKVFFLKPAAFPLEEIARTWNFSFDIFSEPLPMIANLKSQLRPGDAVVIMSNKGFAGLGQSLVQALA